ncbi:MAG: class I SAM-dependent methyltransferase [Planctomycetota bacterium]
MSNVVPTQDKSAIRRTSESIHRAVERLRRLGIRKTLAWARYQVRWRIQERALGIKTNTNAYSFAYSDTGENHGYEPVDYLCFEQVLDYLNPENHRRILVDYGSGMGRALVLAGLRPFHRIVGVEFSEVLCGICNRHLQQVGAKLQCTDISLEQTDATKFEFPDDANAVFLYNSFRGRVLASVLEHIRDSIERKPRVIDFVYVYPKVAENPIDNVAWLEKKSELPTGFYTHVNSFVYQNKKIDSVLRSKP